MIAMMKARQEVTEVCLWKMETRIETDRDQIGAEIKTGLGEAEVSFRLSVLYDCIPYTMRERRGRSSDCGQRPTSSWTYHRPGSISSAVSGALWLDAGPHVDPPVLQ
jgi:hypothetical protein